MISFNFYSRVFFYSQSVMMNIVKMVKWLIENEMITNEIGKKVKHSDHMDRSRMPINDENS